jgi:5-methylthioadenosine/S-adenosylhomocysteine deaminase
MLVRGKYLIADADSAVIDDGAVRIERESITQIGPYLDLKNLYPNDDEIGSAEYAILPGLINAHDHARVPSALQLGIADDFVEQWLISLIGMRAVDPYLAAALTAIQAIESGVTTLVHSFYEPGASIYEANLDASIRAYREAGLRAVMALSILDGSPISATLRGIIPNLPSDLGKMAQEFMAGRTHLAFPDYVAITREWRKKLAAEDSGRISIMLGPVSVHWCSDSLLTSLRDEAKETGASIQTHVLETRHQQLAADNKYGKSMIAHLAEIGFLNPSVSCAHCIWATDDDMELLAANGATVVHNPGSNMRLASGIAPIMSLLQKGVNTALGMDSLGMNDDGDIWQDMRLAAQLQRVPGAPGLSANRVLRMATRAGARMLGRVDVGKLAPGKKADLILVRLEKILSPYADQAAGIMNLILQRARAQDVDTVIVEGEILMQDRRLKRIDKLAVLAELREQLALGDDLKLDKTRRFLNALKPQIQEFISGTLDDAQSYQFNALASSRK